jgi:hypothetical protein
MIEIAKLQKSHLKAAGFSFDGKHNGEHEYTHPKHGRVSFDASGPVYGITHYTQG